MFVISLSIYRVAAIQAVITVANQTCAESHYSSDESLDESSGGTCLYPVNFTRVRIE